MSDIKEIAGAHLSDEQVAGMVRMLTRPDADHEIICVAARDRIMALSAEVKRLTAPLEDERLEMLCAVAKQVNYTDEQESDAVEAIDAIVAEIKRLRAGEDTRLLDGFQKLFEKYRYREDISLMSDEEDGVWFARLYRHEQGITGAVSLDHSEDKAENVRAALRAAIAAEGE